MWLALQSLPSLMAPTRKDILSLTSSYYAGSLAAHIARTVPGMQQAVEEYSRESGDREIRTLVLEEQNAARDGLGSYSHPSEITQRLLAEKVTEAIREWMQI